jgi:hypothetical protein
MTSIENKTIIAGTRLGAMLLDHFFMSMITMVFFLPNIISGFTNAFKVSHEQVDLIPMESPVMYLG